MRRLRWPPPLHTGVGSSPRAVVKRRQPHDHQIGVDDGIDPPYYSRVTPIRSITTPSSAHDYDGFHQARRVNSPSAATELSTDRPDSQLRELAS